MATFKQCQANYDNQEAPEYYHDCEYDNWETESIRYQISHHIARKDHIMYGGRCVVKAGQAYRYEYNHCYDTHAVTGERRNYRVDVYKTPLTITQLEVLANDNSSPSRTKLANKCKKMIKKLNITNL